MIGTVREYDTPRGFGVIVDSETGNCFTVYANYTSLKEGEHLRAGQAVEFDAENFNNNKWAINVKVL